MNWQGADRVRALCHPGSGRKSVSQKEVETMQPDFGDEPLLDLIELETIWVPAEA